MNNDRRRSDHHGSRDSDYGYRDRRKPSSSRYNEDYNDCYEELPKDDPLKKAIEGFSIPKIDSEEKKIEPKTKSLTHAGLLLLGQEGIPGPLATERLHFMPLGFGPSYIHPSLTR